MTLDLHANTHRDSDRRERIWRSRARVDADYGTGDLDLATIARAACYAPHHFHRLFKKEVGMTPHQYVTFRRIQVARRMLIETDESVTNICFAVGFESLGSFSSLFNRYTGHSPSRFRRRYHRSAELIPSVRLPWCLMMRWAGHRSEGL